MRAAFYQGNQTITLGKCVPVEPGPGEVQLKVSHVGICGTDLHIYHGVMDKRVTFPQIMGHEVSGTVSAVGDGVAGFAVGDAVAVMPLAPCNTHAPPAGPDTATSAKTSNSSASTPPARSKATGQYRPIRYTLYPTTFLLSTAQ